MGHIEGLAGLPASRRSLPAPRSSGQAGRSEVAFDTGVVPDYSSDSLKDLGCWRRFLVVDSAVGIVGNIVTTLMTCLLAYAVLFPHGILPEKYDIAVVQARFFELSWGGVGRVLFLLVAAAFLADTWMATADAVARIHTDVVLCVFPRARRWPIRRWYLVFLVLLTAITAITMGLAEPGPLILLSALIGFLGTVSFSVLLYLLNHRYLPTVIPRAACPQALAAVGLLIAGAAYSLLALAYLWVRFSD